MKEFLIWVVHIYTFGFIAILAVLLLDWVLGIDKLNPILDNLSNDLDCINPSLMTMLCALLCAVLYLLTDGVFLYYLYLTMGAISLGVLVLVGGVYLLFLLLLVIRKFFLSLKK